jgi:hypothetical protein
MSTSPPPPPKTTTLALRIETKLEQGIPQFCMDLCKLVAAQLLECKCKCHLSIAPQSSGETDREQTSCKVMRCTRCREQGCSSCLRICHCSEVVCFSCETSDNHPWTNCGACNEIVCRKCSTLRCDVCLEEACALELCQFGDDGECRRECCSWCIQTCRRCDKQLCTECDEMRKCPLCSEVMCSLCFAMYQEAQKACIRCVQICVGCYTLVGFCEEHASKCLKCMRTMCPLETCGSIEGLCKICISNQDIITSKKKRIRVN